MSDPDVKDIGRIDAPYRREIVMQDVQHESGLRMLRIRIREGRRFTILDIDGATAAAWSAMMQDWRAEAGDAAGPAPDDAQSA